MINLNLIWVVMPRIDTLLSLHSHQWASNIPSPQIRKGFVLNISPDNQAFTSDKVKLTGIYCSRLFLSKVTQTHNSGIKPGSSDNQSGNVTAAPSQSTQPCIIHHYLGKCLSHSQRPCLIDGHWPCAS